MKIKMVWHILNYTAYLGLRVYQIKKKEEYHEV
jgi:hypothetical protein